MSRPLLVPDDAWKAERYVVNGQPMTRAEFGAWLAEANYQRMTHPTTTHDKQHDTEQQNDTQ